MFPFPMTPGQRSPAGFLAVALASFFLSQAASAGPGDRAEVVRGVLRERGARDERSELEVVLELVSLGPQVIPVHYELVMGPGIDSLLEGATPKTQWIVGPDRFPNLARQALARLPAEDVVRHLRSKVRRNTALDERLTVVRILGDLGSARGVELMLDIAEDAGTVALRHRSVHGTLERAFAACLQEDADSWRRVGRQLGGLDSGVLGVLVDAVALADHPRGIGFLEDLLGTDDELDLHVLEVLVGLQTRYPWRVDRSPSWYLSSLASDSDWTRRRLAATLVGRLGNHELVDMLIGLLEDSHPGVRNAAQAGLDEIAGVDLGEDSVLWKSWLDGELSWWNREAPELLARLGSMTPGPATGALRKLTRRPLFRHEVARAVAESLLDQNPVAAGSSCKALVDLGSTSAVPGLTDALERSEATVRASAWETLQALTGQLLPLDAHVWEEFALE